MLYEVITERLRTAYRGLNPKAASGVDEVTWQGYGEGVITSYSIHYTKLYEELQFERDDHFAFELIDDYGEGHSIPLHRIYQVYKNGKLIWERPLPKD